MSCSGQRFASGSSVFYVQASSPLNSPFDPSVHLTVSDLQADALDLACFRVHIKCSKTDPFRMGCYIYIGQGNSIICLVRALGNFLALRGSSPGPLFGLRSWLFCNSAATAICGAVYLTLGRLSWFLLGSQLPNWPGHDSCISRSPRSPH